MNKKGKQKEGELHKRRKEPIDYGVTESQFYKVLEKASQPIKKPESDSGTVQT